MLGRNALQLNYGYKMALGFRLNVRCEELQTYGKKYYYYYY